MLPIIICDDQEEYRAYLENLIKNNEVMNRQGPFEKWQRSLMKAFCIATNPASLIQPISNKSTKSDGW